MSESGEERWNRTRGVERKTFTEHSVALASLTLNGRFNHLVVELALGDIWLPGMPFEASYVRSDSVRES